LNHKMSLEEFYKYWGSEYHIINLTEEYLDAQSEKEKMAVLSKYGLYDYKAEIERVISLDTWANEKLAEDSVKQWDQVTTIEGFKTLLNSINLRDCEREYLISKHLAGLVLLWYKNTNKNSKKVTSTF
jgi:hypothetical protein